MPSPGRPPADFRRGLPLQGALELSEDVVREMTTLRVTAESALGDRLPRTLMFVSPQGREGTSTIALQFVQTLARDATARPLLVDGHVRRPVLEEDPVRRVALLDSRLLPRDAPGTGILASNLTVVPASDALRRAGVYSSSAMRELFEAYGPGHDWIVVDGPPVLDSPDAASLAGQVDGVVIVVEAGRTKRPVLTRSVDLLRKAGARVLGSVLNRRRLEIPDFIYRRI
jgi:Mrp family chromosome partitioning ATPase